MLPSQAKPSQAKPSQAKPSQAKPSQANNIPFIPFLYLILPLFTCNKENFPFICTGLNTGVPDVFPVYTRPPSCSLCLCIAMIWG